jgi:hypothetical protein
MPEADRLNYIPCSQLKKSLWTYQGYFTEEKVEILSGFSQFL